MRLFRIEHPRTGYGPFRRYNQDVNQFNYQLPTPYEDKIELFRIGVHKCAVKNLEMLLDVWMTDAIECAHQLANAGFHLLEIECDDIMEGEYQVVFNPDSACVISSIPFKELV